MCTGMGLEAPEAKRWSDYNHHVLPADVPLARRASPAQDRVPLRQG